MPPHATLRSVSYPSRAARAGTVLRRLVTVAGEMGPRLRGDDKVDEDGFSRTAPRDGGDGNRENGPRAPCARPLAAGMMPRS
jgi:hypothetical protein